GLVRRGGGRGLDVEATVDAVSIMVVAVLVAWAVAMRTYLADESLPLAARLVAASYPVLDAAALALALHAVVDRRSGARVLIGPSLLPALMLWLLADVIYIVPAASDLLLVLADSFWVTGSL